MIYDPADYETRHPAIREIMRWFDHDHLSGAPRTTAYSVAELAKTMVDETPDSAELTAGLRKLLEAKDCFVRASVDSV